MSHGKLFTGTLKSCPFCGASKAEQDMGFADWPDGTPTTYIYCTSCGASGPDKPTHVGAARAWNGRKGLTGVQSLGDGAGADSANTRSRGAGTKAATAATKPAPRDE